SAWMGATPEKAAEVITAAGAHAVGANCGCGVETMPALCRRLQRHTNLPLWIKPSAGWPDTTDVHEFARYVPEVIQAGASFIGGCCGTTPAFVRAIATAIEESKPICA